MTTMLRGGLLLWRDRLTVATGKRERYHHRYRSLCLCTGHLLPVFSLDGVCLPAVRPLVG
jgi:hypothetical protein